MLGFENGFADLDKIPRPGTLGKHRLTLDVAMLRLWGEYLDSILQSAIPFIVLALADSSPRMNREWFLSELYVMTLPMMEVFRDSMEVLIGMREDPRLEDPSTRRRCEAAMDEALVHVILLPVIMGQSNTGVVSKFACFMWALRMTNLNW